MAIPSPGCDMVIQYSVLVWVTLLCSDSPPGNTLLQTSGNGYTMSRDIHDDNFVITPKLAAALREQLIAAGEGKWSEVYSEIQDDGKALYISVDLLDDVSAELLQDYKHQMLEILATRVPARISGRWSWTIGIRRHGTIIDSVDALDAAEELE